MPEINTNNMTPEQLNDHINGHPGGKGPATYCSHTVPYGPATGQEDSRAHDPNPNDGSPDKPAHAARLNPGRTTTATRTRNTGRA